jgi:hypothetical protein
VWKYSQASGTIFDDAGKAAGYGYAGGNCGKTPQGKNNPLMQAVHSVGPIPQGRYKIVGPAFTHASAGPFCLRLEPCTGTDTFGRAGFMLHGDTNPPGNASEGCIVQARPVRERVAASGDDDLLVVACDSDLPALC